MRLPTLLQTLLARRSALQPPRFRWWMPFAGAGLAILATSCMTTNRTVFVPNTIPGAAYVGSEACAECHKETHASFAGATHAKLIVNGVKDAGCESCHGAGSKHVEAGGGVGTIINPRNGPETCFQCHLDVRGQFSLPHSHPVAHGVVNCGDCHDPHSGSAVPTGGTSLKAEADTCAQCHTAQSGPFVFEHEALRDGCTTCHSPHGSVNDKMLKVRNQNLCLQCHITERSGNIIQIGGRDHTPFLSRGTCWSAGCHEAIHGSNANSSLRF